MAVYAHARRSTGGHGGTAVPDDPTNQQQQQTGGNDSGYTPPATQEDFNRIIDKRLERERAKFADYEDLKAKAAKVDEYEAANQTAIEKAVEKATAAEAELAKVPEKVATSLRGHLVTLHSISDEDAELFLTASDPETLLKQAERLAGRQPSRTNHVRREGTVSQPGDDPVRQFTRQLFEGARAQT
jgi:hypothetical protein